MNAMTKAPTWCGPVGVIGGIVSNVCVFALGMRWVNSDSHWLSTLGIVLLAPQMILIGVLIYGVVGALIAGAIADALFPSPPRRD